MKRYLRELLCGLGTFVLVTACAWADSGGAPNFEMMLRLSRLAARISDPSFAELARQIRRVLPIIEMARPGATVYYPNGKVATHAAKRAGATLYYPNGKVATQAASRPGATWYYPNGKIVTHAVGKIGVTWYYPNGRIVSNSVGTVGVTWYHPNGKTASCGTGRAGATWYYSSGRIMTTQGPAISPEELGDVPRMMTRLMWMDGAVED